jgi:putative ABC transport system substrate-binding protein
MKAAASTLGVGVTTAPVDTTAEIEAAIFDLSRQPNGGVIFPTDSFATLHSELIIGLAARYRAPAIFA